MVMSVFYCHMSYINYPTYSAYHMSCSECIHISNAKLWHIMQSSPKSKHSKGMVILESIKFEGEVLFHMQINICGSLIDCMCIRKRPHADGNSIVMLLTISISRGILYIVTSWCHTLSILWCLITCPPLYHVRTSVQYNMVVILLWSWLLYKITFQFRQ